MKDLTNLDLTNIIPKDTVVADKLATPNYSNVIKKGYKKLEKCLKGMKEGVQKIKL